MIAELNSLERKAFLDLQKGLEVSVENAFTEAGRLLVHASIASKDSQVKANIKDLRDVPFAEIPSAIDRELFHAAMPDALYNEREVYSNLEDQVDGLVKETAANADSTLGAMFDSPLNIINAANTASKVALAALGGYVAARLYDRQLKLPAIATRDALTALGGADVTRDNRIVRDRYGRHTYNDAPKYGMLYTGGKVQEELAGMKMATGFKWVHITPPETAFEPHVELQDASFDYSNIQDVLEGQAIKGSGAAIFFPGDHNGCRCYFQLVKES